MGVGVLRWSAGSRCPAVSEHVGSCPWRGGGPGRPSLHSMRDMSQQEYLPPKWPQPFAQDATETVPRPVPRRPRLTPGRGLTLGAPHTPAGRTRPGRRRQPGALRCRHRTDEGDQTKGCLTAHTQSGLHKWPVGPSGQGLGTHLACLLVAQAYIQRHLQKETKQPLAVTAVFWGPPAQYQATVSTAEQ